MEGPENKKKMNIYISGYMWTGGPLAKISGPNPKSTINLGFLTDWEAPSAGRPPESSVTLDKIRGAATESGCYVFGEGQRTFLFQNGKSVGDLWKFAFCKSIDP